MNHELYIGRQPYYARYPRKVQNSLYSDMSNRMPPGLYAMSQLDYEMQEIDHGLRASRQGAYNARRQDMGDKGYMGIWENSQAKETQQKLEYSQQVQDLTASLADDEVDDDKSEAELKTRRLRESQRVLEQLSAERLTNMDEKLTRS